MQERNEILRSLGFSPEFIDYLEQHNEKINYIQATVDTQFYESLDSTGIYNIDHIEVATASINIISPGLGVA